MQIQYVVGTMPQHETKRYERRPIDSILRVVIHHSVTECAGDTPGAELKHCRNIARGHIRIAGWPGIGYHFCVFNSGRIYQVNDLRTISHHVGWHNTTSAGVCLIGKLHKREPTEQQLESAAWLVGLMQWPALPHKALNQTACPGHWERWGHIIKEGL